MAKEKLLKRVVAQPRFYMKVEVEGAKPRMQLVPVGTEIEVTEKQAAKAGNKLVDPKAGKVLDGGKLVAVDKGGENTAELKAKIKELEKALKDATPAKMQAALVALQTDLDAANAKIQELEAAPK